MDKAASRLGLLQRSFTIVRVAVSLQGDAVPPAGEVATFIREPCINIHAGLLLIMFGRKRTGILTSIVGSMALVGPGESRLERHEFIDDRTRRIIRADREKYIAMTRFYRGNL